MDSKAKKFQKNILTEGISSNENSKSDKSNVPQEQKVSNDKIQKKLKKLGNILGKNYINIDDLKQFCWGGIPKIPATNRAECWKYLLGFYPLNNELKESTVKRKKEEYSNMCSNYSNALSNPDSQMNEQELAIYRQILKDVPRTMPDFSRSFITTQKQKFYDKFVQWQFLKLKQGEKVKFMMTRILYIWSMRHPASGYVQGFNDLTTPFFVVFFNEKFAELSVQELLNKNQAQIVEVISDNDFFDIETDIYFAFTKLLDRIQTHYTSQQPGITKMMNKMKIIIKTVDPELSNHLDNMEIDYVQFCFRWMNCFLMREFEIELIIRLWDTYFSEDNGFSEFHLYVCSSLLLNFSEKLKKMTEFQQMIIFLQKLPTDNWDEGNIEDLLARSYQIRELYSSLVKEK